LNRYDTSPNRVMKPPSVAHTIVKLVSTRVGMAMVGSVFAGSEAGFTLWAFSETGYELLESMLA
jgi:hypothetical protein